MGTSAGTNAQANASHAAWTMSDVGGLFLVAINPRVYAATFEMDAHEGTLFLLGHGLLASTAESMKFLAFLAKQRESICFQRSFGAR
jgi:hypothetical protein